MIDEAAMLEEGYKLGKRIIGSPTLKEPRLNMMLWGPPGCGKTTLACTAPGRKLVVLFDNNGLESVIGRDDLVQLDLTGEPDSVVESFKETQNPMNLLTAIKDLEVDTIIVDSLTSFSERALRHGVVHAKASGVRNTTLEDPGFKGFGRKNIWVNEIVTNMRRVAKVTDCHIVFTAHEDTPTRDKDGNIIGYTIMLGSSLAQQTPVNMSEVWHVSDPGVGKARRIMIRPSRMRSPMKTRLFVTDGPGEFDWKYDATNLDGNGIEYWYECWKENKFRKIKVPT